MSMHRANKSRRAKNNWRVDPISGEKKVIPLGENMPWFSKNSNRSKRRAKIAKASRRANR